MEAYRNVIFLVDDQKISNFINKSLITGCNFCGEVFTYENPETALKELAEKEPSLVLLDINMPEIDGWKFLELMQQYQKNVSKVIMVTSSTNPYDQLKANEYPQVIDYFVKPLSKDAVARLLSIGL